MAWAQEMKNLAADIKTSHRDRTARLGEIKRETSNILGAADDYMKNVAAELKEMAKNLKAFLADSEETRKKDFDVMMKGIQAKIKDIQGDVKDFLAKSEEKRIVDFKAFMKDVTAVVESIARSTKALLGDYEVERKDAARYWGSLQGKGGGAEVEEAAPKRKGRPRRKK